MTTTTGRPRRESAAERELRELRPVLERVELRSYTEPDYPVLITVRAARTG
jgi:hypothetical protein